MKPALLFDLDGTLSDNDALHFEGMRAVFATHGVSLDWETFKARIIGGHNADIAAEFLPHLDLATQTRVMEDKEAEFRLRVGELERLPGLTELLEYAETRGLATALVTNAPHGNIEATLRGLSLTGRFDVVVSAHDLPRGKPDPLPYLEGLRLLGADAARSVAFEDSRTGVRAASGAGIATVGVGQSCTPEQLIAAGATLAALDFTDPRVMALVRAKIGA